MKYYLCLLGRNQALSREEIKTQATEVMFDDRSALMLIENPNLSNPRDLPKSPDQIFLDRLGGCMRVAEVMGEFTSKLEVMKAMNASLEPEKNKFGITSFGTRDAFLPEFLNSTKAFLEAERKQKIRMENPGRSNMSSGQIFDRKLLKKGAEFIVWKRANSFLLCRTVANQNLRNYTLKDRAKPFRDAKMGMLPPKLAQILINLSKPKEGDTVYDPFCGSGTVCAEAAIDGYQTHGSDLNKDFLDGARKNFEFLSEKFRYEQSQGSFEVSDVLKIDWTEKSGVICTEGFLGTNFTTKPSSQDIAKNSRVVASLWFKLFDQLSKSKIHTVAFCMPAWNQGRSKVSIANQVIEKAKRHGFEVAINFENNEKTFIYERDNTFVAREICVLKKIKKENQ